MRKVALGRLGIPAKDFYLLTLAELFDAMQGHSDQESERIEWHLFGVRRQIYFQLASAGAKNIKEEELIPLKMDEVARQDRLKNMPRMTVTENE